MQSGQGQRGRSLLARCVPYIVMRSSKSESGGRVPESRCERPKYRIGAMRVRRPVFCPRSPCPADASMIFVWLSLLFVLLHGWGLLRVSRNCSPPWARNTSRALLVVAHPDDEALFFANYINSATRAGVRVHVLCLSTGTCQPERNLLAVADTRTLARTPFRMQAMPTVSARCGRRSSCAHAPCSRCVSWGNGPGCAWLCTPSERTPVSTQSAQPQPTIHPLYQP